MLTLQADLAVLRSQRSSHPQASVNVTFGLSGSQWRKCRTRRRLSLFAQAAGLELVTILGNGFLAGHSPCF